MRQQYWIMNETKFRKYFSYIHIEMYMNIGFVIVRMNTVGNILLNIKIVSSNGMKNIYRVYLLKKI